MPGRAAFPNRFFLSEQQSELCCSGGSLITTEDSRWKKVKESDWIDRSCLLIIRALPNVKVFPQKLVMLLTKLISNNKLTIFVFQSFLLSNMLLLVSGVATPFCADLHEIAFFAIRLIMGLSHNAYLMSFYMLSKVILLFSSESIITELFSTIKYIRVDR